RHHRPRAWRSGSARRGQAAAGAGSRRGPVQSRRRRFRCRESACRDCALELPDSDRISPFPNSPGHRNRMPTVRIKENEPFEVAMRRFKRTVEKTGLLTELRAREFYEKPTTERKRKLAAAVKRHHKRLRSQLLPKKMY